MGVSYHVSSFFSIKIIRFFFKQGCLDYCYTDPGCFKLAKGTSKKPGMETTQSTFTIVSSNSPYQTNGYVELHSQILNKDK